MARLFMEILALAATLLIFIFLLRRNLASNKRVDAALNVVDAALNVLLAKHAFSRSPPNEQERIALRARELMAGRGQAAEFQGEVERYGWYALAMKELGIPPGVKGFKDWKAIGNPSTAIGAGDPLLRTAAFLLKKKCGIDVSIS
jgi:hypothetical protein